MDGEWVVSEWWQGRMEARVPEVPSYGDYVPRDAPTLPAVAFTVRTDRVDLVQGQVKERGQESIVVETYVEGPVQPGVESYPYEARALVRAAFETVDLLRYEHSTGIYALSCDRIDSRPPRVVPDGGGEYRVLTDIYRVDVQRVKE